MPAKDPRRPKGESGPAKASLHLQRAASSGLYQDPTRLAALESLLGKGSMTASTSAGGDLAATATSSGMLASASSASPKANKKKATVSEGSASTMMAPAASGGGAAGNVDAVTSSADVFTIIGRVGKKGTGEAQLMRAVQSLVAAYAPASALSDAEAILTVSSFTGLLCDGVTPFHPNPAVRRGLSLCIAHLLSRSGDVRQAFGAEMGKAFAPWLCLAGDPSADVGRPALEALDRMFAPGSPKRAQLFSKFAAKAAKKLFEELARWTANRADFVSFSAGGDKDKDDANNNNSNGFVDPADSASGGAAAQVMGALSILFAADMAPASRVALAPALGYAFGSADDEYGTMMGVRSATAGGADGAAPQPLSFVARKTKNSKKKAAAGAGGGAAADQFEEVEGSAVFGGAAAAAAAGSPASPAGSPAAVAQLAFGVMARLLPSNDEGARRSVFAGSPRLRGLLWSLVTQLIVFVARGLADAKKSNGSKQKKAGDGAAAAAAAQEEEEGDSGAAAVASFDFSLAAVLRSMVASIFEEPPTTSAQQLAAFAEQQQALWASLVAALHAVHQNADPAAVDASAVAAAVRTVLWPSIVDVLDNCAEGDLGESLPEALLDAVSPLMLLLHRMSPPTAQQEGSGNSNNVVVVFDKLVKIAAREAKRLDKFAVGARALLDYVGSCINLMLSSPSSSGNTAAGNSATTAQAFLSAVFTVALKQIPALLRQQEPEQQGSADVIALLEQHLVAVHFGGQVPSSPTTTTKKSGKAGNSNNSALLAGKMLSEVADKIAGWRLLAAKFSSTNPGVAKAVDAAISAGLDSAATAEAGSTGSFVDAIFVGTVRRWLSLDASSITAPEMSAVAKASLARFCGDLAAGPSAFRDACSAWLVKEFVAAASSSKKQPAAADDDRLRCIATNLGGGDLAILSSASRVATRGGAVAASVAPIVARAFAIVLSDGEQQQQQQKALTAGVDAFFLNALRTSEQLELVIPALIEMGSGSSSNTSSGGAVSSAAAVTITTKWVDAALASVGPVSATTASPALSKLLHRFDNISDASSAASFRLPPAASGAIWAWLQRFVAAQQGVFLVPDRKYRAAGVPCFAALLRIVQTVLARSCNREREAQLAAQLLKQLAADALLPLARAPAEWDFPLFLSEETVQYLVPEDDDEENGDDEAENEENEETEEGADDDEEGDEVINDDDNNNGDGSAAVAAAAFEDAAPHDVAAEDGGDDDDDDDDLEKTRYNCDKARARYQSGVETFQRLFGLWALACEQLPASAGGDALLADVAAQLDGAVCADASCHIAVLAAAARAGRFPAACASPETWNRFIYEQQQQQQPQSQSQNVFSLVHLLSSKAAARCSVHDFGTAHFPEPTVRSFVALADYGPETLSSVARVVVCLAEALFAAKKQAGLGDGGSDSDDDDDSDFDDDEEEEDGSEQRADSSSMASARTSSDALQQRQADDAAAGRAVMQLPGNSVGAALLLPVMQLMSVRYVWTARVRESLKYIFNWCIECVFASATDSDTAAAPAASSTTVDVKAAAALAESCVAVCLRHADTAPFLLTGPLALLAQMHAVSMADTQARLRREAEIEAEVLEAEERRLRRRQRRANHRAKASSARRGTAGAGVLTVEEADFNKASAAVAAATRRSVINKMKRGGAADGTTNYERLLRAIYGAVANAWIQAASSGAAAKPFAPQCFSPWPGSALDALLWKALMPRGISLPATNVDKLRRLLGAPATSAESLDRAVTAMQLLALLPESVAAATTSKIEPNHVIVTMRGLATAARAASSASGSGSISATTIYMYGLGIFGALSRCGIVAPAALPEVASAAVNCLTQSYRLELLPPAGKFQFQQQQNENEQQSAATAASSSSSILEHNSRHRRTVQALSALRHGVKAHMYRDDQLTSAMNLCVLDMGCALGARLQKLALADTGSNNNRDGDEDEDDDQQRDEVDRLLLEAFDVSAFLSSDFLSSDDLRALRASAATVDPVARFVLGTHFWLCSRPLRQFEDDEFVAKAVTIVNLSAQLAVSILIGCRALCQNESVLQALVAVFSRSPLRALPARGQVIADISKRLAELQRISGAAGGSPASIDMLLKNSATIANPRRQLAELLNLTPKAVNLSAFRRHSSHLMQSSKSRVTAISYFTLAYVYISLTDDERAAGHLSTSGLVQVADSILCCLTIKDNESGSMLLATTPDIPAAALAGKKGNAAAAAAASNDTDGETPMSFYLEISTVADPKWLQPAARSQSERGVSPAQLRAHCGRWAAALLGLLLQRPVLLTLRAWIDSLHSTARDPVVAFVNAHFSPFLARMALMDVVAHAPSEAGDLRALMARKVAVFNAPADLGGDKVLISVEHASRRVTLAYVAEEIETGLAIRVPAGYPLGAPRIEDSDIRIQGVAESKRRAWLLRMSSSLMNGSATLWDSVQTFCKNLASEFEGVEPCVICYMIVTNNELPTMSCKVCRNSKYHRSCLAQWWSTAPAAICPLCRSPWML